MYTLLILMNIYFCDFVKNEIYRRMPFQISNSINIKLKHNEESYFVTVHQVSRMISLGSVKTLFFYYIHINVKSFLYYSMNALTREIQHLSNFFFNF